jgi:hypothetical protein
MAHPKVVREHPERLNADLIWGVKGKQGIAAELGIPERRAYHLIHKNLIPHRKLGPKTIVAFRSALKAFLRGGGVDA